MKLWNLQNIWNGFSGSPKVRVHVLRPRGGERKTSDDRSNTIASPGSAHTAVISTSPAHPLSVAMETAKQPGQAQHQLHQEAKLVCLGKTGIRGEERRKEEKSKRERERAENQENQSSQPSSTSLQTGCFCWDRRDRLAVFELILLKKRRKSSVSAAEFQNSLRMF